MKITEHLRREKNLKEYLYYYSIKNYINTINGILILRSDTPKKYSKWLPDSWKKELGEKCEENT